MTLRSKFVELSTVTDDTLEHAVNHWVEVMKSPAAKLMIRFVVPEHSKRPAMAFVSFTRDAAPEAAAHAGAATGHPHVIAADDNDVD